MEECLPAGLTLINIEHIVSYTEPWCWYSHIIHMHKTFLIFFFVNNSAAPPTYYSVSVPTVLKLRYDCREVYIHFLIIRCVRCCFNENYNFGCCSVLKYLRCCFLTDFMYNQIHSVGIFKNKLFKTKIII